MRREPRYSGKFKRDVKVAKKHGKDMAKLKTLIGLLIEGRELPASYLDHPLKGRWHSSRNAHIKPDWLLIYKLDGDILRFERTALTPTCSNSKKATWQGATNTLPRLTIND